MKISELIRVDWLTGVLMVMYVLLLAGIHAITQEDIIFYIFAWPHYLFHSLPILALFVQILYMFVIVTIIRMFVPAFKKPTKA